MKKQREKWVDYTKAFACILVVIGHLLQGLNLASIKWNINLYYNLNKFMYIFHMPLFMCLSGYLYGKTAKISSKKDYVNFIKKKIINLSIPYFVFYITHVLINIIFSSSVNSPKNLQDILNILTNPIPPFWFLYALIFIFILIPIVEYIFKNNKRNILFFLTLIFLVNIFIDIKIYAINVFCEFAVFFYLGTFIDKLENINYTKEKTLTNTIIFVILSLVYCYLLRYNVVNSISIAVIKFILAIYGIVVSIAIIKNYLKKLEQNKWYDEVSKYTFQIYLMHTIFSAGIRICLIKLNIMNFYVHFILGMVAGILGPIIISKILEKTKYGNIIIYPLNTIKKINGSDIFENTYSKNISK